MRALVLMGIVGGQRAMTPLAAVSIAAWRGELAKDNGAPAILARPTVAAATLALAIAEMAGDKQKTAPDRIVPIGLTARFITAAVAGMALAPQRDRWAAAAIGGVTAVVASYPGWRLRMAAMADHGQTPTGFIEDAAVVTTAVAIIRRR